MGSGKMSRRSKEAIVTGCTVAGAGLGAKAGMAGGAASGGPLGGAAGGLAGGVAGGVGGYVVGKTVVEVIEIVEDPEEYARDKVMGIAKKQPWQVVARGCF